MNALTWDTVLIRTLLSGLLFWFTAQILGLIFTFIMLLIFVIMGFVMNKGAK